MARTALEHALPAGWIDEVFDEHRERQYSRELLFSTVVELVTLVSLGLRPSLHAAARTMATLPVTLTALYDKVNRTEPAILRALVRGNAERLAPVAAAVDSGTILPGWQVRILDGNHLPASEKRLVPLRQHRGAALPGQALVVSSPAPIKPTRNASSAKCPNHPPCRPLPGSTHPKSRQTTKPNPRHRPSHSR